MLQGMLINFQDLKRTHSVADEGESRKSSKVVSAPVTPSPELPSPEAETDAQKERRKNMVSTQHSLLSNTSCHKSIINSFFQQINQGSQFQTEQPEIF